MIKIIQGDALTVLRTLKDNCIQTCVTSPPYWGLRDYGGEPQIWGGSQSCAHDFVEQRYYTTKTAAKMNGSAEAFSAAGPENAQRLKDARWRTDSTCKYCQAWYGQLGLEPSPKLFIEHLVQVFREVHRALKDDGVAWIVIGDCYAGSGKGGNPGHSPHIKQKTNAGSLLVQNRKQDTGDLKAKQLIGIPWRLAFALQDDGWFLRSAIIWAKPNGMPGSQQDRCSTSYEMIFMLSKEARYWSDFDAIKTPPKESTRIRVAQDIQMQAGSHRANAGGKTNGTMKAVGDGKPVMMRDVWFITPRGFKDAHFATFPEELAERCILAGSPPSSVVLDPFAGSGTVGMVANKLNRHAILIELNADYVVMANRRCAVQLESQP